MHSTETRELNRFLLESSNLPAKFHNLDVETYKGRQDSLLLVGRYTKLLSTMREDGLGLFFRGPSDSYKTFLACYVAMFAMCNRYSAQYYSMPELVDGILKNEIRPSDLKHADFLVLDNLNAETNGFWLTALDRLLTYRRDAGKPVLLCSRLTDSNFEATYGKDNLKTAKAITEEVVCFVEPCEVERRRAKSRSKLIEEV